MRGRTLYVVSARANRNRGIVLGVRHSGRAEVNTFSVVPAGEVFVALAVKMHFEGLKEVVFKPEAFKALAVAMEEASR